jgi:TetR/AcrR family transcriptional regulator, lmrAB and yxaGH operons repressor
MMARIMTDRSAAIPALAEAFREHGFEGASLAHLCEATGLGKGSLYHFFPGGKDEMAAAVLADVDAWITSLAVALRSCGQSEPVARAAAIEAVAAIQGGIVLSRALNQPEIFMQVIERQRARLRA